MPLRTSISLVVLAALAASPIPAAAQGPAPAGLEGRTWQLVALDGVSVDELARAQHPVTLTFANGEVRGRSGCNGFGATYTVNGSILTISRLVGTMMACPEPSMKVEQTVQRALQAAERFAAGRDRLAITFDGGRSMVLRPAQEIGLDGATWTVRTLARPGAARETAPPRSARLTFAFDDDRIAGHAGCNTFRGLARRSGDRIEIGPLATTKTACAPELMALERDVVAALSKAARFRLRRDTLDLLDADGARLVSARRTGPPPPPRTEASPAPPASRSGRPPAPGTPTRVPTLEGREWRLIALESWPENDPVITRAGATLTIRRGEVTGHAGCNRYRGRVRIDGPRLRISGLTGTLMACDAVEVETAFRAALGRAGRYEIADGRLRIAYGEGQAMLFSLEPPPRLTGVAWTVTGIDAGTQAVAPIAPGSNVSITFAGGDISGSTGCNAFTGTYTVDGQQLAITATTTTARMCAEPALMEQERRFLSALSTVATWRVASGRLELRTKTSALALTAARTP
jgi:heat shock protein HslJ